MDMGAEGREEVALHIVIWGSGLQGRSPIQVDEICNIRDLVCFLFNIANFLSV